MSNECLNQFHTPSLILLIGKGMGKIEVSEETIKHQSSHEISLTSDNKYHENYKPERKVLIRNFSKLNQKFTDEFLIDLINDNPNLNMKGLSKLANSSVSTISNRLKQVNCCGKMVSYIKRDFITGATKITDEFLINLVNENPSLGIKELAKLANISNSGMSRRLKQIYNRDGKFNFLDKNIQNDTSKTFGKQKKFSDEFLIDLIKKNPELSIQKLAKLANCSSSTIFNRLNQINSSGKRINYIKKDFQKKKTKFTDESLVNLIKQNPDLSMKGLAKIFDCSSSFISRRIKKINSNGDKANYIMKGTKICISKFTDEFLINLINENPDLDTQELARLADCSKSTILARIRLINKDNIDGQKVIFRADTHKRLKRSKKITDEYLVNLVKENPNINMKELARLANTSVAAISKRLKNINSSRSNDHKTFFKEDSSKPTRGAKKFSDEFLIDLINKNPDLNMTELSKLANTSVATISKRLKEINSGIERVKYTKKYSQRYI